MAVTNKQKVKLLKLLELLRQESDEDHPLRTSEICDKLAATGTSCDRRTLSIDISLLKEQGFDIRSKRIVHELAYYIDEESRWLTAPELKIIIDAIQAADFITEDKTEDLVEKVSRLGGTRRKEIIATNIVKFNSRKHTNEEIYENVDTLEHALIDKKQASFYYFKLNENGEKVYQKEKKRYVVEPIALIFDDDNYYLLTWNSKHEATTSYRVDRMDEVAVEDAPISEHAMVKDEEIAAYTGSVFKMYGGELRNVTLDFDDKLLGPVQDKFGENVRIIRTGEHRCVAAVQVQESPTFWGWMFQFAGDMKILTPEDMVEKYKERARKIIDCRSACPDVFICDKPDIYDVVLGDEKTK